MPCEESAISPESSHPHHRAGRSYWHHPVICCMSFRTGRCSRSSCASWMLLNLSAFPPRHGTANNVRHRSGQPGHRMLCVPYAHDGSSAEERNQGPAEPHCPSLFGLLVHHMGKGLADDITQGLATGDMFRTTPLWGVGQRIFLLHDGRATRSLFLHSGSEIAQALIPSQTATQGTATVATATCEGRREW
jgi:hypothetical protein